MSYKSERGNEKKKYEKLVEIAESNGWKSGVHISKCLTKNQFYDYVKVIGRLEGMSKARKSTMDEMRLKMNDALGKQEVMEERE